MKCPFSGTGSAFLWRALVSNEIKVVEEVPELWVHAAIGLDGPAFDLTGHAIPVRLILDCFRSCVARFNCSPPDIPIDEWVSDRDVKQQLCGHG